MDPVKGHDDKFSVAAVRDRADASCAGGYFEADVDGAAVDTCEETFRAPPEDVV